MSDQTPFSVLDGPENREPIEYPGAGLRFLNYLVDYISFYVLAIALGVVIGLSGATPSETAVLVIIFIMMISYYVLMEGLTGQTIGKMLTRTEVVNDAGQRPSFGQILGRTLIRLVPFEALSAFFGERMWHDKWSGTHVIRRRR